MALLLFLGHHSCNAVGVAGSSQTACSNPCGHGLTMECVVQLAQGGQRVCRVRGMSMRVCIAEGEHGSTHEQQKQNATRTHKTSWLGAPHAASTRRAGSREQTRREHRASGDEDNSAWALPRKSRQPQQAAGTGRRVLHGPHGPHGPLLLLLLLLLLLPCCLTAPPPAPASAPQSRPPPRRPRPPCPRRPPCRQSRAADKWRAGRAGGEDGGLAGRRMAGGRRRRRVRQVAAQAGKATPSKRSRRGRGRHLLPAASAPGRPAWLRA